MAQKKKVPPTPQQHSSSSDDEEEEVEATTPSEQADSYSDDEETSGEDEEDVTPLAPVNKPTPPVEQHSSSSDDSEEEEEEEEEPNVTPVAPVKPVVVQSPPKVRRVNSTQQPDLAPATAPASAVTVGKKRPAEESKAVSKKFKKKRVVEEVVKKVPKTPTFQRVFTEADEIAILEALLNYSAEKSIHPIKDTSDFHDFVRKSVHFDVTKDQLSRKIKSMKRKYKNNASKKKQTFGKEHDKSCYDISKKIWGKSSSAGSDLKTTKEKRIPKMKNMTPGLQIPQVVEEPVPGNISWSELAKTRDVVGMMCLRDDTFKINLELLSNDEARAALEEKLKNIVTDELELTYKRLELSREVMKSSLDEHHG